MLYIILSWTNLPVTYLLTNSSLTNLYTYNSIVTSAMQQNNIPLTSNIEDETISNKDFEDKNVGSTFNSISQKSEQIEIQQGVEHNIESTFGNDIFHINDNRILSLLNEETGSNYSFKGLMRKLNLHQQSLARALDRLEELGLIYKTPVGYKLSKNGELMRLSKGDSQKNILLRQIGRDGYIQLFQTYIPINIKTKELVRNLIGKWFYKLRWIRVIESEIGYLLQWMSDDNSFQINLRVVSDYFIIETDAASDKEKVQAMVGSCKIFEYITKALQSKLEAVDNYRININQYIDKQNN